MINNAEINICSWNARGLNNLVKLKQVLGRLKQMKSKIIFLQETDLLKEDIVESLRDGQSWFSMRLSPLELEES